MCLSTFSTFHLLHQNGSTVAPSIIATSGTHHQRFAVTAILSFIVRAIRESRHHHGTSMFFMHENANTTLAETRTKINHMHQITNPKSCLLPLIAKPPPPQRRVSSRCRHLHISPPSTTDLHPCTTPICHAPATQQTHAHFAIPKSHFAKPKRE